MTLGERIRQYRTDCGLSQGDFAERMDVSRQSVSKWENDLAVPELDKLVRMCAVFGITLDTLVRGGDIPNNKAVAENTQEYTSATADPAVLPDKQVPVTGIRKCIGILLICTGTLLFFILAILGGILTGLVMGLPFVLIGVYCLVIRRCLGLWIGWTLVLMTDLFCQFANSAGRGVFWNFIRFPSYREFTGLTPQLIISFLLNLLVLVMVCITLFGFRQFSPSPDSKNIRRTALVLGGRILVWGISMVNSHLLLPQVLKISDGDSSSVWLQIVFQTTYFLDLAAIALNVILLVLGVGLLRSWLALRRRASVQ